MNADDFEAHARRLFDLGLAALIGSGEVEHDTESARRLVVSRSVEILLAPSVQTTAAWGVRNPANAASNLRAGVSVRWALEARDRHADLSHPTLESAA